ncbi:MAG TPA: DNA-binding domain-containing protein [Dongiaceae bacterium]|jgi:hypothetical protein
MKLADLQGAYRGYLLTGDSTALTPAILADAFDAAERLGIYRNNFLISLGEALKASFPVTLRLVGSDFFAQAARRFVLSQPPCRPCLFEYGAGFADYLRTLPELAALPYVADVAAFEYARVAAYHAPAEQCVSAEMLAGIAPERLDALPIRPARHAQILAMQAPVLALWQAHQEPEPDLAGIDMTARPHMLLVCRPDRTLMMREIDRPAGQFLLAAAGKTTLGLAAAQSGIGDGAALSRIIALALELRLLATP